MMKLSLVPQTKQRFLIIATDPDAPYRSREVRVDAISPDEAKTVARHELARDKSDHWYVSVWQAA